MHYAGIAVNDKRFFPLYRVCAERHLPVFCHTGLNGPDWPRWAPSFRVNLGNPLLLEDVLAAFPDLVIVMCHMSYPSPSRQPICSMRTRTCTWTSRP